jgi:hypothetical protein
MKDRSTQSEVSMLPHNETTKSNGAQEPFLVPSENKSAPSSSHVDDWRELARRIQEEPDSSKIVNLVQQLIAKFDERNSRIPRKPAR